LIKIIVVKIVKIRRVIELEVEVYRKIIEKEVIVIVIKIKEAKAKVKINKFFKNRLNIKKIK
jgi:hypothetical protein